MSVIPHVPGCDYDVAAIFRNKRSNDSEDDEDIYGVLETTPTNPEIASIIPDIQSNQVSCNSENGYQQAEDKGKKDFCPPRYESRPATPPKLVEPDWGIQSPSEYGLPNPWVPGYKDEPSRQCSNKKYTLFCIGQPRIYRVNMLVPGCQLCRFSLRVFTWKPCVE